MKAEPNDDGSFDTEWTDQPVCPYCGEIMTDAWEIFPHGKEDTETECGECDRKFYVTQHISIDYSTSPIDEAKDEET